MTMTTKSHPLVTIGIPTLNRADSYLRQVLRSALNQTYQKLEIIVADNCSTDNTETVVRSLADARMRYFKHDKNIGANNDFNFCLSQARGDYFLLLHDDDLIDEDFVQACMLGANYATHVGIIRTGTRVIDSQGKVLREAPNHAVGLSTEDFFRAWFTYKTEMYLCSTLFNTAALKAMGGFSSKHNLFQDVMAEVQLAAKYGRVDVQDIKASFRRHPDANTFAARVADWCEDSLLLLDLICDLVPGNKAVLRREGMRLLSTLNYNRAAEVRFPIKRLIAYFRVFRAFNYRYIPPPIHDLCERTPGYYRLQSIRRRLREALADVRR